MKDALLQRCVFLLVQLEMLREVNDLDSGLHLITRFLSDAHARRPSQFLCEVPLQATEHFQGQEE